MRYWVVTGFFFLSGCAPVLEQAKLFPATWPGSAPLSENAPTVSVQPIQMKTPSAAPLTETAEGVPTLAVLTALFIKYLHAAGVNAILEQAEEATAPYAMGCAVSRLGYTQKTGYPEQYDYQAELICTLTDTQKQQVVWKRSLQQRYETASLINMFSKIPEQPNQHDRTLYTECIVPLWDAMASSVRTVLISRQPVTKDSSAVN